MSVIKTQKKLHEFRRQRKDAREVLRFKLYEDVHDIRKLDKHIEEFQKALKDDLKTHNSSLLKKHAKEFEQEVYEELTRLLDLTRADLDIYLRTLRSLADLKALTKNDPGFHKIVTAELRYAEVIHRDLHHKINTLHKMFYRMQGR